MTVFSTSARGSRGFTLIELGMVVAILILVALVAVPSIEGALGVRTREETAKVAGSIRAMYGESVLSGRTCRIVFDMAEDAWWPECAAGRVRVKKMEESLRGARVEEEEDDAAGTEEEIEARKMVADRNAFAAYESNLAPKRKLPDGLEFQSIWTQHQEEPYTAGQAYLYFFPNGQSERAYLYLTDGSDTYTVIVKPMTGRTKVVAEYVEIPDSAMEASE